MEGIMDLFGITDGNRCEDICKHAPPENKWPCIDCDMRWHDRAEPKDGNKTTSRKEHSVPVELKC